MPLAIATASSSSSNGTTTITGPKISSRTGVMSGLAARDQRGGDVEAALHVRRPAAVDHEVGALLGTAGDVRLDAVTLRAAEITGPTMVSVSSGSPTFTLPANAASLSTSSSYLLRCTIARVGAVQICPLWNAHTLLIAVTAARELGVVEHERRALAAELEQHALHRGAPAS